MSHVVVAQDPLISSLPSTSRIRSSTNPGYRGVSSTSNPSFQGVSGESPAAIECALLLISILASDVLVISKRVVPRMADLTSDEMSDLFISVQHISRVIEKEYGAQSMTVACQVRRPLILVCPCDGTDSPAIAALARSAAGWSTGGSIGASHPRASSASLGWRL